MKAFLTRPILAIVLSIFIVLVGVLSFQNLPVAQYPSITPPMIQVSVKYPGASAEKMASDVAEPLERAVNGVKDMIYMFSENVSPGIMHLKIYFRIGCDSDMALVNVQNRVNLAQSALPEEVKRLGVLVEKTTPNILLFIAVEDARGIYDDIFLTNYANIQIRDELARIKGVAQAEVVNGRDYSMRVWIDPGKMAQFKLMPQDVIHAIREQNGGRNIGEIGQEPNLADTKLTIPVTGTKGFSSPEEFENIVIRAKENGALILLKDIARVELGSRSYETIGALNLKPGAYIAINQDPTANSIDVSNKIKQKMEELKQFFPEGMTFRIPYDISNYIKFSIWELQKTLLEATILVSIVIFLFLHTLRASFVPIIAMIISIIGTFTGLLILGYSVNTLTLFGVVLAVGIVVDDAIVIVENVEYNISHLSMNSFDAAKKSLQELTGPILGIVCSLCAVFVPVAFMGGIPGVFYKQFALTIVISIILSGFVALTLSPVLCVMFFKKQRAKSSFGEKFDQFFNRLTESYATLLRKFLQKPKTAWSCYFSVFVLLGLIAKTLPLGFIPKEDQGLVLVSSDLPDGASLNRTDAIAPNIQNLFLDDPAVKDVLSFSGYNMKESVVRTSSGSFYVSLKDWNNRKKKGMSADGVIASFNEKAKQITDAKVIAFNPPTIPGIGVFGGFDFWIINTGQGGQEALQAVVEDIVKDASKREEFDFFITSINAYGQEIQLDIDTLQAKSLGINLNDVNDLLQTLLGSIYVNDFSKFGRNFHVVLQADQAYRNEISDIGNMFVRDESNHMIPLNSILKPKFSHGPVSASRFNGLPAAHIAIVPNAGPEVVMKTMEQIAKDKLKPGMSYSWSGLAYQQKEASGAGSFALIGSILLLFLCLAALYEHWGLPLVVLMAVPFAIFGAIVAVWARGLALDLYFQIALITLIGLSAKNAILIVEFAKIKFEEGMDVTEAAIEAGKLRLRAIIMTSLTMIVGMIPLALSAGAGAASRHSIGTGLIGGMILSTVLSIFFAPLFFQYIEGKKEAKK